VGSVTPIWYAVGLSGSGLRGQHHTQRAAARVKS
jgi:hypothetical protein